MWKNKGRKKKKPLRELVFHDVFVSLGSTDADERQLSTAAVQTQLRHVMTEAVLTGHSEAERLPLIQEALGHLHYPGERDKDYQSLITVNTSIQKLKIKKKIFIFENNRLISTQIKRS